MITSYVVHGHTPTPHLTEKLIANQTPFKGNNGVIFYGEEYMKIDIDCGTAQTGRTALFDLDTFQIIPFKSEVKEDEN